MFFSFAYKPVGRALEKYLKTYLPYNACTFTPQRGRGYLGFCAENTDKQGVLHDTVCGMPVRVKYYKDKMLEAELNFPYAKGTDAHALLKAVWERFDLCDVDDVEVDDVRMFSVNTDGKESARVKLQKKGVTGENADQAVKELLCAAYLFLSDLQDAIFEEEDGD